MIQNIQRFTRNCQLCIQSKAFRNKYFDAFRFLFVSKRRWNDVLINFVVRLSLSKNSWKINCENMMIITNRLSKIIHVKFINELISQNVIKIYYIYVWKYYDLFKIIIINRETQFVNHFWDELCHRLKTKT